MCQPEDKTCTILFELVFPIIGCILSNIVYLSPLRAILRAQTTKTLGSLNPLPYALIFGNSLVWTMYSFVTRNYFVFWANIFGLALGIWYTLTAYAVGMSEFDRLFLELKCHDSSINYNDQNDDEDNVQKKEWKELKKSDFKRLNALRKTMRVTVVALLAGLLYSLLDGMVVLITLAGDPAKETLRQNISGYSCVVMLLLMYSSPLSTLLTVIKTHNSSSFDFLLSVTVIVNSGFWVAYGLGIGDAFIWGPNSSGVLMGLIQVVCIYLFPARPMYNSHHNLQNAQAEPSDTNELIQNQTEEQINVISAI